MECYKKLNAELITELRAMREQIAIYQRNINDINGQLFNERRLRVEQKQYILQILENNYRNMVKKLQDDDDVADVSLSSLISNNDESESRISNNRHSDKRRSCKEILENFRHSLKGQETRQKINTISPVLRSSNSTSYNEDINSNIMENSFNAPNSPVTHRAHQFRNSTSDIADNSDNNISNELKDSTVELSNDDNYENPIDNDIENETEICKEEEFVTELKTKISQLNFLDNINEEESDLEETSTRTDSERTTYKKKYNLRNSNCLRDLANSEELVLRTIPSDIVDPPNLTSLICSMNYSTLENGNFTCSTPYNNKDTILEVKYKISQNNVDFVKCEENTLDEHRERPQRSCRPIDLREKSLRTKLRSDSSCSVAKTKKLIPKNKIKKK